MSLVYCSLEARYILGLGVPLSAELAMDVDPHLRDVQRQYLDFLDDDVCHCDLVYPMQTSDKLDMLHIE